jgi:hypothetical protein
MVANSKNLHSECLPPPLYSPDLVPSDFHVLGALKEELSGRKSKSDEEVKEVVHDWLYKQPKEFFFKSDSGFSKALLSLCIMTTEGNNNMWLLTSLYPSASKYNNLRTAEQFLIQFILVSFIKVW